MSYQRCPIYGVGRAGVTQVSKREDGVWFMRRKVGNKWGAWLQCTGRPYEFDSWLDTRAGSAKLPQPDNKTVRAIRVKAAKKRSRPLSTDEIEAARHEAPDRGIDDAQDSD